MKRYLPSQTYLLECLEYFPESGLLFWKIRPQQHFSTPRGWKVFNGSFSGKQAFTTINLGYYQGGLDGKTYQAHRIIWKMVTAVDPVDVDHIDHCGTNNKWANLRNATRGQNNINSLLRKGVHFIPRTGRWRARLTIDYKPFHIGYFSTEADALAARKEYAKQHFGDFVPCE